MPDPMPQAQNQSVAPGTPADLGANPAGAADYPASNTKADGGVLGHAALGALQTTASTSGATPPPMEGATQAPPPMEGITAGAPPPMEGAAPPATFWDKAKDVGHKFWETMPIVGQLQQVSEATSDWATRELAKPTTQISPWLTLGTGLLRDTAETVHGITSPTNVGLIAGTALGGALVSIPAGLYLVGKGLYNMHQGWGDIRNPEVLQKELENAAQVTGGAAMVGEGTLGAVRRIQAAKATAAPDLQYQNFKNAVPPTSRTPYSEIDWQHARPYLEAENTTGTPITDVKTTIEAANNAISKIELEIKKAVDANPDVVLNVDVLGAVRDALKDDPTVGFMQDGMKSLEKYRIGFERSGGEVDPPLTLRNAEELRQKMNAENTAMRKAMNNNDFANMLETNPAFAARVAAAEAIRSAIYDKLTEMEVQDAQLRRLDEGSLIKIRNAANAKEYGGEQEVRTGKPAGRIRRMAQKALPAVGAAMGFEVGAKLAHPLIGASIGAEAGSEVGRMISPERLTRDQLIERAFSPQPQMPTKTPAVINPESISAAGTTALAHALPTDTVHVRASDGSEYIIPVNQLGYAAEHDPGLQIIRSR
jgi:hypothetical protein